MKVSFYGGAKRVTGSNYYIETDNGERFVLDCGMFQGSKAEEAMNQRSLPYDVANLDFMILSHAHIDHSGRIPYLVKNGFQGDIICTKATADLAELMLADSAKIQEADAEWETRKNQRKNAPEIEPLYTMEDVEKTIPLFRPVAYEQVVNITEHVSVRFVDAGHILGSASIELWVEEGGKTTKLVFSGDLGMRDHMLIRDPQYIADADYLMLESTYGNTVHGNYQESLNELMAVIEKTTSVGGTVIIPSFAVGRTQEIIYEMNKYYEHQHKGQKNPVPIYVDSPMANKATSIFMKNTDILDVEAQELIRGGDNIFSFENLNFTESADESKMLNEDTKAKVIISASGMATGGRVRHHLKHNLWNPSNAVIFVGYQAEGTLGRIIQDGAEKVKILGEWIACRAKVYDMEGFSAHADQPSLLDWLNHFERKPKKVFLIHGEEREMLPLAEKIKNDFSLEVDIPEEGSTIELHGMQDEKIVSAVPGIEDKVIRLEKEFMEVQELIAEFDEREVLVTDVNEERLEALENTLHRLRSSIMDLNMITGK